jgi:Heavy metal binding domain
MNMRKGIFFIACLSVCLLVSCGQKSESAAPAVEPTTVETPAEATIDTTAQGKEFTSAYICPMHCEGSGSETAGVCPVCGMDYVMNRNLEGAPHDDHEGHNH